LNCHFKAQVKDLVKLGALAKANIDDKVIYGGFPLSRCHTSLSAFNGTRTLVGKFLLCTSVMELNNSSGTDDAEEDTTET
jgi:hypothetical protein